MEHANAWQGRGNPASFSTAQPPAGLLSADGCVISDEHYPAGYERLVPLILYGPSVKAFGPVEVKLDNHITVFLKQESWREMPSPNDAANLVRSVLVREKIRIIERDRAHEWVAGFRILDRIPYTSLGFPVNTATPWERKP